MDWIRDLPTWPNASASKRISCAPHRWHVQIIGQGPDVLLLHGSGSSAHSWAGLIDQLHTEMRCIAVDMPGHGFTQSRKPIRNGRKDISQDLERLILQEGWSPKLIIGHSAGAVVALDLAARMDTPVGVVGLNAALAQFDGVAGWLFPIMARTLASIPFTARLFSAGPNPQARARRLILGTGSVPPPKMMRCYSRLISDRDHVAGALNMMAQWSLDDVVANLSRFQDPVLFITAENDRAVPAGVSHSAAGRMPNAKVVNLTGLGHLAHEEDPGTVARIIKKWVL
jgi:magnesium chelatase accessory protein